MALKKKAKKKAAAPRKQTKKAVLKKAGKAAGKKRAPRKAAGKKAPAGAANKGRTMTPAAVQKRKTLLGKILLRKRNEVVENLERQIGRKLMFDASQKIDSAMDSGDQSAQDMDQGIDYSLLEMKYEQYKDIADAFRKLQNDTYGLCEECGEEIDIKRMEVNPLARYCISCKTHKEELERIRKEETRFKE